jgi:transcriptional regulator with XRE-family HTH domain
MFQDDLVDAEWIRGMLRSHRRTQKDLASALGIDASAVSRVLDGHRKLRPDELARIRAFFDPNLNVPAAPTSAYRLTDPGGERSRSGPVPRQRATGDIPIYGSPNGPGPVFEFPAAGPTEYRTRPDQLLGVEGAFGVYAPGDFLAPRYRAGEVLYVHPGKPPTVGSDCLIRLKPPERIAILRYLGREGSSLGFGSVSSAAPCNAVNRREIETFEEKEISQIGRIVLVARD